MTVGLYAQPKRSIIEKELRDNVAGRAGPSRSARFCFGRIPRPDVQGSKLPIKLSAAVRTPDNSLERSDSVRTIRLSSSMVM